MGYLWWFIRGSLARAGRVARDRDRDRGALGRGRTGGGLDGHLPAGQLTVGGGIRLHPLTGPPGDLADDPGRDPRGEHAVRDDQSRRHRRAYDAPNGYACGWEMLISQGTPNWSTHMPNSSPQTCFCSGMVVVPPADSLSQ